ncbi:hypothetical protein ACFWMP_26030 [Paenibacillus sp. NPDC058367]|uniref:hypothetical protein n=1 Tax=Paenibacillus sp. NPDC058367 TaxID=3346460 RepID=UPI00365D8210
MSSGIPTVSLAYTLSDVSTGVSNWFSSTWLILAFAVAIPLSFFIAHQVKGLFN